MKAAPFDYHRPSSIEAATRILAETGAAKVIAGGQTLGPMLNLRLAQPAAVVDVTRIAGLATVAETPTAVTFGACITHAAIEDGRTPDPARGGLAKVARGIAYRAVRTRGTIGGSLAHADPAADWLSSLLALKADIILTSTSGERRLPLERFVIGPLLTDLGATELVTAVTVPKLQPSEQFGYAKLCRKTGEFAHAIGAVVIDRTKSAARLIAGASEAAPIVIEDGWALLQSTNAAIDREALAPRLVAAGLAADAYTVNTHVEAIARAVRDASTP